MLRQFSFVKHRLVVLFFGWQSTFLVNDPVSPTRGSHQKFFRPHPHGNAFFPIDLSQYKKVLVWVCGRGEGSALKSNGFPFAIASCRTFCVANCKRCKHVSQ